MRHSGVCLLLCGRGPGIRRRWGFDLHITVGFRGRQWGILPHGASPVVHISGRFREWSPLLSCLHLAGEDFYQFILYSVVAASQSAGGLGSSTACLPAVAESTLFIFLKFFHLVDHRMRCDSRGLDATPEAAVADPDTCGWTSTESGKG